jgi:hypothetical protein
MDTNPKQKQRTTAALRRIAVYLPEQQRNPGLATDAALCGALTALIAATGLTRSATYTLHSLIRSALQAQFPDGRTRWPIFWTKGRCCRWITGKELCLANTMPYQRMLRFSEASPMIRLTFERVAQRILMRTTIRRPSTGRKVFAFLWGFVIHPSVGLAPYMETGRTGVHQLLQPNPIQWLVMGSVFTK